MQIKRLLNFIPEKDKISDTEKVRFRVKWNNSKNILSFGMGVRVESNKWSYETQRCKNNTTHGENKTPANIINRELQRINNIADETFAYFENKEILPTKNEYKEEFNKRNGKIKQEDNAEKSFFEVYEEYATKQGIVNSWSKNTYYKFNSLKKHIVNFNKNISFDIINEDFMIWFISYLQSSDAMKLTYKNANTGMKNISILSHIKFFKTFLRWSKKHGYYGGNVHEDFNPKFKGIDVNNKEIIHLTWGELIHLYNFKFENSTYEDVRDVFCFCCFTGLRYSDVKNLSSNDIKNDCIYITTQKTIEKIKIELNKYSRAILNKYKDTKTEKALPVTAKQTMNEHLKEMGKIAGIDQPQKITYFIGNKRYEEVYKKYELLTTHCGRRTFIVNSLFLGIPAEVVMKWTGHSDYASMKPYVKIVDELKRESMNKFDLK